MIRHLTVILNPVAANGFAEQKIPEIRTRLDAHTVPYTMLLTEYPGHAKELAIQVSEQGETAVVAAGGDGTINEVINGLMEQTAVKQPFLGIIPIGRGNDFAFGVSIPKDLDAALDIICDGFTKHIDIGQVKGGDYPDGRWFGNGIGIGFDTIVGLEAAKMKHLHGAAGYIFGALKTLILYPKAPTLTITHDNGIESLTPALVSIMNGQRMGGSFLMAPEGDPTDGLFNLCMTDQGRRGRLLKDMLHYFKGTQASLDDTYTLRSTAYRITAEEGTMAVHADGETICIAGTSLEVTCHHHAVQLLSGKGDA